MQDLEALRSGAYRSAGLTRLKLSCPLDTFPQEIFDLGATLEHLDLSGTGLSALPPDFGDRLPELKIAFFSHCRFAVFPPALARCPKLEMVAFRRNGMAEVPEGALPPRLRWLILTDNRLEVLPASIGRCARLQKCMLAGNRLRALPDEMAACRKLGLLRLSANRLERIPEWVFELPELAFLSFAGNPCCSSPPPASKVSSSETAAAPGSSSSSSSGLPQVSWADIEIHHVLGEGASGIISKGVLRRRRTSSKGGEEEEEVAVKLFRGSLTSDGTPADEMAACMAGGRHENIIGVLGQVKDHPDEASSSAQGTTDFKGGLVMDLIPPRYRVLGQPPSFESCTRDRFHPDTRLSAEAALSVVAGVASAAAHLHGRGIKHGDLYAHNILISDDGHAILGDFGAATLYRGGDDDSYSYSSSSSSFSLLEKVEVLAFAHLIEDVLGLVHHPPTAGDSRNGPQSDAAAAAATTTGSGDDHDPHGAPPSPPALEHLKRLHRKCSVKAVVGRPTFSQIVGELRSNGSSSETSDSNNSPGSTGGGGGPVGGVVVSPAAAGFGRLPN